MTGYSETYNQHLKRIAREKEEAHYKKLADRQYRRETELPEMERRIKVLKWEIKSFSEEEAAERQAEEAKAKE